MQQLPPRRPSKLAAVAPLILVTALAAIGMLFFKLPERGLIWSELQNSGHFVVFLCLALLYTGLATKVFPDRKISIIIWTIVILSGVGLAIELVQLTQDGRNPSTADVFRNLSGTVCGILLYLAFTSKGLLFSLLTGLAVLICAAAVNKTSLTLLGYQLLKSGHPYIVNFNDRFVESNLSVVGGADIAVVNRITESQALEKALRVNFSSQKYSGIRFHETGTPWSIAETLVLEIDNPAELSQHIHIRIHDIHHNNTYGDRFNTTYSLSPGKNTVPIPIDAVINLGDADNGRKMDLENISEIQVFSSRETPQEILITSVYKTQ